MRIRRFVVPVACVASSFTPSASAQWYWPPELSAQVQCGDVAGFATLTLSGTWPNSCIPRAVSAALEAGEVVVTLIHDNPSPICLEVLRPYSVSTTIILFDGEYPVSAVLESATFPPLGPTEVGRVSVRCLPACLGDFNRDGGVDGADVEAFFIAWESADPAADVNLDGGVDGADVSTFFTAWETGGCGG